MALATPLGFLALPISRKKAKVRWVHIVRIALYGQAFSALAIVILIGGTILWMITGGSPRSIWLCLGAVPSALLVIWWCSAVRYYLRLPHAIAVGIALSIMAGLVIVMILVWWALVASGVAYS